MPVSRYSAAPARLCRRTHTETFAVTLDALSACEGNRAEENVTLEAGDSGVVLRWDDRSIPRSIIVESQPTGTDAPAIPTEFASNPSRLLTALKDAMETTHSHVALDCDAPFPGRDWQAYDFRFRLALSKRSGTEGAEASVADGADGSA